MSQRSTLPFSLQMKQKATKARGRFKWGSSLYTNKQCNVASTSALDNDFLPCSEMVIGTWLKLKPLELSLVLLY